MLAPISAEEGTRVPLLFSGPLLKTPSEWGDGRMLLTSLPTFGSMLTTNTTPKDLHSKGRLPARLRQNKRLARVAHRQGEAIFPGLSRNSTVTNRMSRFRQRDGETFISAGPLEIKKESDPNRTVLWPGGREVSYVVFLVRRFLLFSTMTSFLLAARRRLFALELRNSLCRLKQCKHMRPAHIYVLFESINFPSRKVIRKECGTLSMLLIHT